MPSGTLWGFAASRTNGVGVRLEYSGNPREKIRLCLHRITTSSVFPAVWIRLHQRFPIGCVNEARRSHPARQSFNPTPNTAKAAFHFAEVIARASNGHGSCSTSLLCLLATINVLTKTRSSFLRRRVRVLGSLPRSCSVLWRILTHLHRARTRSWMLLEPSTSHGRSPWLRIPAKRASKERRGDVIRVDVIATRRRRAWQHSTKDSQRPSMDRSHHGLRVDPGCWETPLCIVWFTSCEAGQVRRQGRGWSAHKPDEATRTRRPDGRICDTLTCGRGERLCTEWMLDKATTPVHSQLAHERCVVRVQMANTPLRAANGKGSVGIAEPVCTPMRGCLRLRAWFVVDV